MSGTVISCGASNFSGFLASFFGSWSQRRQTSPGYRGATQLRRRADRVEPGAGVGVVGFAAVAVKGDGFVQVDAVSSPSAMKYAVSVGVISMVARKTIPVRPLPPTVAQNSSASSPSGVSVRIVAVGHEQVHRPHVVAEAARAVMVLAVDVAGDRAADR